MQLRRALSAAAWGLAFALLGLVALVPDLPARLAALRRVEGRWEEPACSPAERPCALSWPDGLRLQVGVEPRAAEGGGPAAIPTNTPITVRVEGEAAAGLRGQVIWTGHDMSMGRLALPLVEVAPGRLEARGPLPACVRGQMIWRLDLELDGPSGPRGAHALLPSRAPGG